MIDQGAEKAWAKECRPGTIVEVDEITEPGIMKGSFMKGYRSRDAEVSSLRSDVERLRKAIKEYKAEMENPVPDVSMRRALREKLFKAVLEDANE